MVTKTSHREEVVQLRKENPYSTLAEIADQVGITRQGVYEHLKRSGMPTSGEKLKYYCNTCHIESKEKTLIHNEGRCTSCRIKYNLVESPCNFCGEIVIRRRYLIRGTHCWCNRVCQGKWLGSRGRKKGVKNKRKEETN